MFPYTLALIFCPGDTTIEASKDRQTGSSTIKKGIERRGKEFMLALGWSKKRSKGDDDDTKEIWNKFLAKRAFDQGLKIEGESQPWVYPLPTPPTFFHFDLSYTYALFIVLSISVALGLLSCCECIIHVLKLALFLFPYFIHTYCIKWSVSFCLFATSIVFIFLNKK